MSESKRANSADLAEVARRLTAEGKLIEAGFVGLRIAAIPADAPAIQVDEMRNAFFAGAQHLFSSIMQVLDPDAETGSNADLERMDKIDKELRGFINEYTLRRFKAEGSA